MPSRFARGTRQPSNASVAVLDARRPILSSSRTTLKPGVPFSNIEHGDRLAAVLDLAPLAEQQIEIGVRAVGDERLGAAHDDVVAIGPELGLHAGRVGARARLGDRERSEATVSHHRQQTRFLLLACRSR